MSDRLWEDPDSEDRKFIWFNALKEINKTGEQHVGVLKVHKWRFCLYAAEVKTQEVLWPQASRASTIRERDQPHTSTLEEAKALDTWSWT